MKKVKLLHNAYNSDTELYALDTVPNGYLTQDKRTLLVLEAYIGDGDNSQIDIIEEETQDTGVTVTTTWSVTWSYPVDMLQKLATAVTDELKEEGV